MSRRDQVRSLFKERERSLFSRLSLLVLGAGIVLAWNSTALALGDLFQARRLENLRRFVLEDVVPEPLRAEQFDIAQLWYWFASWCTEVAAPAAATTVPIAVLAIVIAGAFALPASILSARLPASADACGSDPTRIGILRAFLFRTIAVLARAVPEYVLAFCLLGLLGVGAWPAVLALALHNAGILTRLGGDAVEDLDPRPLRALRATGARGGPVVLAGILPGVFGRFLLYFFYRFETCLRESTALGLLGIVSLGYYVEEARAHQKYDELLLLMVLAAVLFGVADWVSIRARRWLETGGEP